MQLGGTYTFAAPVDIVWSALMDPVALAQAMPGGEQLVQVGENQYEAVMQVRVGPVQGRFEGRIELLEIVAPESYRMKVSGQGSPGFVDGDGTVRLQPLGDGSTLMTYQGDVNVGGKIAGVGQRVMQSSAKSVTRQGLEALDREIQARQAGEGAVEQGEGAAMPPADAAEAAIVDASVDTSVDASADTRVDGAETVADAVKVAATVAATDATTDAAPEAISEPIAEASEPAKAAVQAEGDVAAATAEARTWKPVPTVQHRHAVQQTTASSVMATTMKDVARDLASDYLTPSQQDKVFWAALGALGMLLFVVLVRLVQRD